MASASVLGQEINALDAMFASYGRIEGVDVAAIKEQQAMTWTLC